MSVYFLALNNHIDFSKYGEKPVSSQSVEIGWIDLYTDTHTLLETLIVPNKIETHDSWINIGLT